MVCTVLKYWQVCCQATYAPTMIMNSLLDVSLQRRYQTFNLFLLTTFLVGNWILALTVLMEQIFVVYMYIFCFKFTATTIVISYLALLFS